MNYDLYAQGDGDHRSFSGWSELRLFGLGAGTWSTSAVGRSVQASGHDDRRDGVRLDTSWQLDFPDSMVSLAVGDAITGALAWTRPTRIGGVRVSRNFALQPYRVTAPLASFAGEAALPSTVDLFIDGIRQSSRQVRPGQFQIDSVPTLNGAGQAQMVITDINGQSRVIGFSLYNAPQLLQAGLGDWSLELGKVRRDYGLRSSAYASEPMASATGRYGLNRLATLEGHFETVADLRMAGAGGVLRLGEHGGVLDLALAASRHAGQEGRQRGIGYQWISRAFSVNLASLRRSEGFRDAASLEGTPLPLRSDRIFIGVGLPYGQVGSSYLRQEYPGLPASRYLSLSWSQQLRRYGSLNLGFSRDLDGARGDSASLYWSMPLDRHLSTSASAHRTGDLRSLALEANRAVPSDEGGWGWRAQATLGDRPGAQAQLTQLGSHGQWSAGLTHWRGADGSDGATQGYASANGGLLLMRHRLFALRRVEDAFALVSTQGVAGVPVMLENRPIGQTDRDGLLLVTRLNAWQRNRLSIDPLQLPADMHIERTGMDAVPESRSGMLALFPMRRTASVQLALRGRDGEWLPPGTVVGVEAPGAGEAVADTVVGYDGLVYLQDPPVAARLRAGEGPAACSAALPDTLPDRGWVELGELECR
ncbi:fimbria/pilus outer membrane usher protein [Pseudoxanthomonas broegbernensis]|uniref:fimbria/pilus outer membrane usher protein n=1 Tax=Pseudoxanthomonas broegbernensis TaxID=83619 RepID=UPI001390872D|nr:fimbria/pilus outer membrane usher protein [Pseudoxanthomonas broegbernensis]MBB6063986.1 outer membrane usher protein [Pseudoxanthomonas broegbernensis]